MYDFVFENYNKYIYDRNDSIPLKIINYIKIAQYLIPSLNTHFKFEKAENIMF